ncbi:LysE family translocator [Candidatus Spongiihabitans sp.]|uniref:LysE family translocator n=1 Tax=Candidatus Spongiihabitans sp. TaxID=3101308 RepID=UPI003C6EA6C5
MIEFQSGSILSLLVFAIVMIMTPGPNNVMFMNSGAIYGLRKTVPHILGVSLGSPMVLFAVATGGTILFKIKYVEGVFGFICSLYLLYLAYKVATSKPPGGTVRSSKPFTFLESAGFQWVNPKIWSQYITVLGVYIGGADNYLSAVLFAALIFAVIGIPNAIIWTIFGIFLSKFLKNKRSFRIFSITMAVILVISVLPLVINKYWLV